MSQIPSGLAIRHDRARDRHARCPVCKSSDVDGLHVDRCEERERYRSRAQAAGLEADVPAVTTDDLWAHLNSRVGNGLTSAIVVEVLIDLGWRPVVGSDPARLWQAGRPMTRDDVIATELARLILGGHGPVRHELRMDFVGAMTRHAIAFRLFSVDVGRALTPAMTKCARVVAAITDTFTRSAA